MLRTRVLDCRLTKSLSKYIDYLMWLLERDEIGVLERFH